MLTLTLSERMALVALAVGIISIVGLATMCVVCPACWIYKKINRSTAKKPNLRVVMDNRPQKMYGGLHPFGSHVEKEPPPPYEVHATDALELKHSADVSIFNRKISHTNSNSSTNSATDSITGIPLPSIEQIDLEPPESPGVENEHGHVTFCIQYAWPEVEDDMGHLIIHLKEASGLPCRPYGGRCDPYFMVQLYRTKGRRRLLKPGMSTLCQFETQSVKKCQHPVFNERYVVPLGQSDLRKVALRMTAWDRDKLANDTLLGEMSITLKELNLRKADEEKTIIEPLREPKYNNGELLLGLCYLPTAERMTVAILKASNLRQADDGLQVIAPYVQAMAMYGGKIFEKHKTSARPGSSFPVFNEMLMFDIPRSKLDSIMLLVVVRDGGERQGNGEISTPRKDPYMGKIVIGSCCKRSALHHWNAMKNSPRRQVVQWHVLR